MLDNREVPKITTPDFPNGIALDVWEELNDTRWPGRQHYSRATYALGCHGPLCQMAETHRGRIRTKIRAEAAGRDYVSRPVVRKTDRDAELLPIITWHLHQRSGKINRLSRPTEASQIAS